jgi:TonB family protein
VHFAAARFRFDQELACDADVLASFPKQRRTYADAMLKTQLADFGLPVGCHWQTSHPLKERIAMLKHPLPGSVRKKVGLLTVMLLVATGGYGAWAAQPGRAVAADAKLIEANFTISVDGAPATKIPVVVRDGEAFNLRMGESKPEIIFEFTAHSLAEHQIQLSGRVQRDGVLLASPSLRINEGQDSAMVKTNADGSPLFDLHVVASVTERSIHANVSEAGTNTSMPALDADVTGGALAPPSYPTQALAKHLGGSVQLRLRVGVDGSVKEVKVESSEPAGVFDRAAKEAAAKWRFPPGKSEHWLRVPITFSPTDRQQQHRSSAK